MATEDSSITISALSYTPLDKTKNSIRLLRVLPGKEEDQIECQILDANLDECPNYIALSYTWDHQGQFDLITCCNTVVSIGHNLWCFLLQYRRILTSRSLPLWIDALCINQGDTPERNHQVHLMRLIYSRAHYVISWLGELERDEAYVFENIADHPYGRVHEKMELPLLDLTNKNYWSRVWVIQEVILARNWEIWCGQYRIPGQMLFRFVEHWDVPKVVLYRYRSQTAFNSAHPITFSLVDLLSDFYQSRCTQSLDGVYGLLGIADVSNECHPIIPNYDKKAAEVILEVLRNQTESLTAEWDRQTQARTIRTLQLKLFVTTTDFTMYLLENCADIVPPIVMARMITDALDPKKHLPIVPLLDRAVSDDVAIWQNKLYRILMAYYWSLDFKDRMDLSR